MRQPHTELWRPRRRRRHASVHDASEWELPSGPHAHAGHIAGDVASRNRANGSRQAESTTISHPGTARRTLFTTEARRMRRFPRFPFLVVPLFTLLLSFGSGCRGAKPEPRQESRQDSRQPEYVPTATIKDIMLSIVDPSADVVWDSVQTVVTAKGIVDKAPRTNEE